MGRVVDINPESINSVMGTNWYQGKWGLTEEDFLKEQDRAIQNIESLSLFWHATTRSHLESDLEAAQISFDDCTADLLEISALETQQQLDVVRSKRSRLSGMFRVLNAAIKVLNVENWMLEDLHSYGVADAMLRVAQNQIREKAAAAQKSLAKLESKLREASKLYGQSIDQLKITALMTAISPLIIPAGPIGILAGGVIGIGQIVLDDAIGAPTSAAASIGGQTTTVLGVYSSAMKDVLDVNKEHMKAARFAKLGKGLALLGVAFDVNEVIEAGMNEAAARAEFEKAAKDWEALAKFVDLNDEIIDDCVRKNKLARKETEKRGLANIKSARNTLDSEIKSTGYKPM